MPFSFYNTTFHQNFEARQLAFPDWSTQAVSFLRGEGRLVSFDPIKEERMVSMSS